MKKNLSTILILISITCFGQNSNKRNLYYFQNNEITKKEFKSLDSRKVYTQKTKNDSLIIENTYLHKNRDKLDSIQHKQITMLLTKIIGSEFKQDKKTILHFYRKNKRNIYKDSKHKKYWKWIKNNSSRYQSFLIGTKDSQIKLDKKNHIYIDEYNLFEKLFFQNSNFEMNHLLIKPNNEIYIYFGLNDILYVLDWSLD